MFTGNRGCLVDDSGEFVRHHRGSLWITCRTSYRDWRFPLTRPGRWTPIFFLDDAVSLAAGHRPCGLCRREDYQSYRDAVTRAMGSPVPLKAVELNRRLTAERLHRGRGLDRRLHRKLWTAPVSRLPTGTVVIVGDECLPRLVHDRHLLAFSFDGWSRPMQQPARSEVQVLTPPTSVAALAHGFVPVLHPSAAVVH